MRENWVSSPSSTSPIHLLRTAEPPAMRVRYMHAAALIRYCARRDHRVEPIFGKSSVEAALTDHLFFVANNSCNILYALLTRSSKQVDRYEVDNRMGACQSSSTKAAPASREKGNAVSKPTLISEKSEYQC
jgi:hypothetical protein